MIYSSSVLQRFAYLFACISINDAIESGTVLKVFVLFKLRGYLGIPVNFEPS